MTTTPRPAGQDVDLIKQVAYLMHTQHDESSQHGVYLWRSMAEAVIAAVRGPIERAFLCDLLEEATTESDTVVRFLDRHFAALQIKKTP